MTQRDTVNQVLSSIGAVVSSEIPMACHTLYKVAVPHGCQFDDVVNCASTIRRITGAVSVDVRQEVYHVHLTVNK
jgi:hypothetical protein